MVTHFARSFVQFSLVFASLSFAHVAEAQLASRGDVAGGWCAIQARVSVKLGAAGRGEGYGRIVCDFADGSHEIVPIRLRTKGMSAAAPASPKSRHESIAKVFSTGFAVSSSGAQVLMGTYVLGHGGSRLVGIGHELGVNMAASRHGFAIPLTVQTLNSKLPQQALGFGIKVGYMQISVDPQNTQGGHLKSLPIVHPVHRAAVEQPRGEPSEELAGESTIAMPLAQAN